MSDLDYNLAVHELSVTESILNIALKYAEKESASQVTDIYLLIGELSSIVDDSVQFYWDMISQGTICEKAKLHFERKSAKVLCKDCGNSFNLNHKLQPCPACASLNLEILSGDEFHMQSIEINKMTEKISE